MTDVLLDSLRDCLRLLPFLFLAYLVIEYIEHRMSDKTKAAIYRAGKAGPVLGSLIGIIPQCGFAAAAAGLFAAGVVSPGTLIAVFLSTSDEMLPIMLSEMVSPALILRILILKVAAGILVGYLVDFAAIRLKIWTPPSAEQPGWQYDRSPKDICERDRCGCAEHGIFRSAVNHTVKIMIFLFLITLVLGFGMEWFKESRFVEGILSAPVLQEAVSALIGVIPNCAASVFLTELFLEELISGGALFAGLLCSAGTGLLVLFRENKSRKENFVILLVLYASSVILGFAAGALSLL